MPRLRGPEGDVGEGDGEGQDAVDEDEELRVLELPILSGRVHILEMPTKFVFTLLLYSVIIGLEYSTYWIKYRISFNAICHDMCLRHKGIRT